ncbi:phage tail tube protein [Pyramidobacter piscolens]|uniref:phage tail tube protein n=1 Tax=Pyramidobacter piscolens TaxID=638849 RepID=UPI003AB6C523
MPVTLPANPSQSNATVGKDYLLYVNTGTADVPVWTLIGGQRSADLSRSADEIDVSHKTSGGWKGSKAGLRSWSIDLGAMVVLDDTGLSALETAFQNGSEINVKLKYPNNTMQTGWGSLTEFSLSTPHDGAAEISGTISGNGPLSARAEDS